MIKVLFFFLFVYLVHGAIIPSEVMFHPRQNSDLEYFELHNNASGTVDISDWTLFGGINFTLPAGASISSNGYAIVTANKAKFLRAYPTVSSSIVYGDFVGHLSDTSDTVTLRDASVNLVFSILYKDSWQTMADGFGSSLELICDSANISAKHSWKASILSLSSDPFLESPGSPGSRGTWYSCPAPSDAYDAPNVVFNEVMYHPYQSGRIEYHEFVEIYNKEDEAVTLSNWRLISDKSRVSGVHYEIPSGTTIDSKGYLVIAKDPTRFKQVYTNVQSPVVGGYSGELGNSNDNIALVDSNGELVELLEYSGKFPWPEGADADPVSVSDRVQFKGLSMQRVSTKIDAKKRYNWVAATPNPGAANTVAKTDPDPVVTDLNVFLSANNASHLVPDESITVIVKIGPNTAFSSVSIVYFMDNVDRTGSPTLLTGAMNNISKDEFQYVFNGGFPQNSIVRFKIQASWSTNNNIVIFPRSNDHAQYETFFVAPALSTNSTVYHLFISHSNWNSLWTFIEDGLYMNDDCCTLNPSWNNKTNAILGYKNKAYDIKAKYQGSPYNRERGDHLANFVNPPDQPSPLLLLSWKFELPEGVTIDGKDFITLLKPRDAGVSFLTAQVTYHLARQIGLPANPVHFARLHINGQFYAYEMDVDYYSNGQINNYIDDVYSKECDNQASETVGYMYKAHGYGCEGPIGPANEEYLYELTCNATRPDNVTQYSISVSSLERTTLTYDPATFLSDRTWNNVLNLTDNLFGPNAVDFTGEQNPSARNFFNTNFDINHMLNYLVLINWIGAWDDLNGNHMIYQRITDGKWTMVPWDADGFFGFAEPCINASCSIYLGEEGAPVGIYQIPGGYNVLKNAFIKAFRPELNQRFMDLAKTSFSVENVNAIISNASSKINATEYDAPFGFAAFDSSAPAAMMTWHQARWNYVTSTLAQYSSTSTNVSVCPMKPRGTPVATYSIYRRAPGAPQAPKMVSTDNGVSLTWDAPNGNGADITSYKIQRKEAFGTYSDVGTSSTPSYVDTGITKGAVYNYHVKAINSVGESAYSLMSKDTNVQGGSSTSTSTNANSSVINQVMLGLVVFLIFNVIF